jgi:fermentation-respiration switch protein FrsA (DUF1100 family)
MSAQLTAPYKIACPWEAAIHRQARTTVAIAALALWTAATAVRAEAPPPFRLLFAPSATSWNSWGSSARDGFRADPAVRGQTAYRVVVSAPGAHPWDAGATILTEQAMRQGDRLIAAFWARADDARDPTDACDRGKATLHSAAAKGEVTSANLATGLGQVCDPALLRAALYDPALVLKQLSLPTLVIAGALDLQVPPDRNLPIIRAAMADNPDLTVIEFPGLNHLLRYAKTGGAEEWTAPGGPTDDAPEMVEVVADWVARHAAAKAGP